MKSNTYYIFHHQSNKRAVFWAKKINAFIRKNSSGFRIDVGNPAMVIALGGDGTILEAARKYHERGSVILGLNLGNVGFLASVREEKNFLAGLSHFFKGRYDTIERMMILAQVERKGKIVFKTEALNEIVIKNPLGMVELEARVSGHPVKHIRGTGILTSTATGSTAYNLSAHGPIIMPNIKCFVVTELLDHSIPSPSLVIEYDATINITVISYRKRGVISLGRKKIDVLITADGESVFPLQERDVIKIQSSPHLIKFAELEKNYFFKSLKQKFGFR